MILIEQQTTNNKFNFPGSDYYWKTRYQTGGNSGAGSYGKFAEFKAGIINQFVDLNHINFVIEFGCGDGNQLSFLKFPRYLGFDISDVALSLCRKKFEGDCSKKFKLIYEYNQEMADLTISIDVIFHLIEDSIFEEYMNVLFSASKHYVIIYSSNFEDQNKFSKEKNIKHREFTKWVQGNMKDWILIEKIPNIYPYYGDHTLGSFSDFYIYRKKQYLL